MGVAAREPIYGGKQRRDIYLAGESFDFVWSDEEVRLVREIWNKGGTVEQLAETVERRVQEVMILLVDLAFQRRLARRVTMIGQPGGKRL